MPTVAISMDFLEAFAKIPKAQQKKVRAFTEKFQRDPTQNSINYEPIYGALDDKVRTVRIGDDYRAIIVHPTYGDVYLLVWVDHHDEAMAWSRNRKFKIHSETGALQIVYTSTLDNSYLEFESSGNNGESDNLLFTEFTDQDLLNIGVPEESLTLVRDIRNEDELDKIKQDLPDEAYEGLFMLAAGFTVEETLAELERDNQSIDLKDFEKALDHPDTRRRFIRVSSSEELLKILDEPLTKWRVFLHPSQRQLAYCDYNGSIKVTGGAGTGKTVVAMHRARYLVSNKLKNPSDKVLFTTFTKNLARSIEDNLRHLCSSDESTRIDVVNLHAWAYNFLKENDIELKVVNNPDKLWKKAAQSLGNKFSGAFCREEWERIICHQGITDRQEYLKAPRIGRGTRLSRPQRDLVWKVCEAYQDELRRLESVDWLGVISRCREYLTQNLRQTHPYRAIIIDEGQDLHAEDFRLLRAIVPEGQNDLFIVGDPQQRIYDRKVVLSRCGINVKGNRSKFLRINYRTTDEIRKWSMSLLNEASFDDMDGGIDTGKGYKSLMHGPEPEVISFGTASEEVEYIIQSVEDLIKEGMSLDSVCLVVRTKRLLEELYKPAFEGAGIPWLVLDGKDSDEGNGIRLATMHRVKGLEFQTVIIASANEGLIPHQESIRLIEDHAAKSEAELRERSLFHVASSRARDRLLVTSYGNPSPYLTANILPKS